MNKFKAYEFIYYKDGNLKIYNEGHGLTHAECGKFIEKRCINLPEYEQYIKEKRKISGKVYEDYIDDLKEECGELVKYDIFEEFNTFVSENCASGYDGYDDISERMMGINDIIRKIGKNK